MDPPRLSALTLAWDDGVTLHYQATLASSYGGQFEVLHGTHASVRLAGSHGWLFTEADAATQGCEVYAACCTAADALQSTFVGISAHEAFVRGTTLEVPVVEA